MATLRQYFETDFSHMTRVSVRLPISGGTALDAVLLCDFAANLAFLSCYVPDETRGLDFFRQLVRGIEFGKTPLDFAGQIVLPAARTFPGAVRVQNSPGAEFDVAARFYGDPHWVSMKQLKGSSRIIVYSETQLSDEEYLRLINEACEFGIQIQFRSKKHAMTRSAQEVPLAFISHDSRDKKEVVRKIAINLERMMCPVWYDEFSLKVGANLRESIESGLKNCKKCVLVLSKNFFANGGWTKKEFDSIFTREILEEKQLVLPVWYGVNKNSVYAYSPTLLNVKGLDWETLGEEEVCRQLHRAIVE